MAVLQNNNVIFCGFKREFNLPNLGVGYLVSNLKYHGFNMDYQYIDIGKNISYHAKQIARIKPKVLAISAASCDFKNVISLSEKVKSLCDTIVLLGGAHITSVPQTLPKSVDVGLMGESEEIIVEIFRLIADASLTHEELRKIKSIVFFDNDGKLTINARRPSPQNIDALQKPAREIFEDSFWESGVTSLLTSRGCPYNCSFCQISVEWRVCRYNSVEYIVEEIQELVTTYGIHTFVVVDDLFIARKKRIRKLVERLKQIGLLGEICFTFNGRANLISEDLLELLVEMNTVEITLGLESMSPRILPLLKDQVTVDDNMRTVDLISQYGLRTSGLFIFGTPGETLEDMAVTYDYVAHNRHKFYGMQVCVAAPLPKTCLWEMCVKRGKVDSDIAKFNWDKLGLIAEGLSTNLYIGDIPKIQFMKVLKEVKKLFFGVNFATYIIGEHDSENPQRNDVTVPIKEYLELPYQPKGDEKRLVLDIVVGANHNSVSRYRVTLKLINEHGCEELFCTKFDTNRGYFTQEFDIPSLEQVKGINIMLRANPLCKREMQDAEHEVYDDIAIRKLFFLKQAATLLPLAKWKVTEILRELFLVPAKRIIRKNIINRKL